MEMNEQMVEAKMQLATSEQKLKLVEEALEREREKWRQETVILQEQVSVGCPVVSRGSL